MISSFIKKFTDKTIPIKQLGKKYYLADQGLLDLRNKIGGEVYSEGVFLGEEKDEFFPRPALIEIISKISDRKAVVDEKAEWMFLCGKEIFKKAIVTINAKPGELVLVQNQKDENLGYGRYEKGNIKNLLDRGIYLREKQ